MYFFHLAEQPSFAYFVHMPLKLSAGGPRSVRYPKKLIQIRHEQNYKSSWGSFELKDVYKMHLVLFDTLAQLPSYPVIGTC